MAIYHYSPRPVPDPSTGNFALLPRWAYPAMSVQGAGTLVRGGFLPFQGPQVYIQHAAIIDGVNGIHHGDIELQGLLDSTKDAQFSP